MRGDQDILVRIDGKEIGFTVAHANADLLETIRSMVSELETTQSTVRDPFRVEKTTYQALRDVWMNLSLTRRQDLLQRFPRLAERFTESGVI